MEQKSNLTLKLSKREAEVLTLVANGLVDKEIATELNIAYGTVRNHINKIVLKLAALNRTHAVALAIRNNLI